MQEISQSKWPPHKLQSFKPDLNKLTGHQIKLCFYEAASRCLQLRFSCSKCTLEEIWCTFAHLHQPANVCFWPSPAADQSLTQQTTIQKYLWRVHDSITVLNTLEFVLFSWKRKEIGEGRVRIRNTWGFLVCISLLFIVVRTTQKQNTWCRAELRVQLFPGIQHCSRCTCR